MRSRSRATCDQLIWARSEESPKCVGIEFAGIEVARGIDLEREPAMSGAVNRFFELHLAALHVIDQHMRRVAQERDDLYASAEETEQDWNWQQPFASPNLFHRRSDKNSEDR